MGFGFWRVKILLPIYCYIKLVAVFHGNISEFGKNKFTLGKKINSGKNTMA